MRPSTTEHIGHVETPYGSGRDDLLSPDERLKGGACPTADLLWPLVVHETPVPGVIDHVLRCRKCRDRVSLLENEVASARGVANRSAEPVSGDSALTESEEFTAVPSAASTTGDDQPSVIPKESAPTQTSTQSLSVVGKYFILETIRTGGQATVYRGFHPSLLIDVVIKLAHEPCQRDQSARARLVTEAKALAEIVHPNMARLYDLDFHEDRPFLVLEYVRGMCLREYRDRRPLKPVETAMLVAKVARAVSAAHDLGILHLDLKPDNIMVTTRGEPVLIDFGMSILTGSRFSPPTQERCIAGTPQYMSPEQTRGRSRDLDVRTDVFGLGAVLYDLLVGRPPFEVSPSQTGLQAIESFEPDWRELAEFKVPPSLRSICRKAMASAPQERHNSAKDLARELEATSRKLRSRRSFLYRLAAVLSWLVAVASFILACCLPNLVPREETSLSLRVIRSQAELPLRDALPLRTTDRVRFECRVSESVQTGVFALSNTRSPQWFGPVRGNSAERRLNVMLPNKSKVMPLLDRPDTLLLLLTTRRDGFIGQQDAMELATAQWFLPPIPPDMAILLSRDHSEIISATGTQREDVDTEALHRRLHQIRHRLALRFDNFAGIMIGKDTGSIEEMASSFAKNR